MPETYEFEFDINKNAVLKKERGISFEEIILLIDEGSRKATKEYLRRREEENDDSKK